MKTIVSLTTIPSRIENLYHVIRNLKSQSIQVDKIELYIPHVCYKSGEKYIVPSLLQNLVDNQFEIMFIDCDFGPATKLIPAYLRYKGTDARIITVDDDILLEEHSIEELCNASDSYPDAAIGLMGILENGNFIHAEWLTDKVCPIIRIGGYRGMLYPVNIFDDTLCIDYEEMSIILGHPFLCDDSLIGSNLYRRKKPMYCAKTDYPKLKPVTFTTSDINIDIMQLPDPLTEGGFCTESHDVLKKYYNEKNYPCTI